MPRGHYLTEAVKDAIWELRAEGGSEAEIGRRLGLPLRLQLWRASVNPHGRRVCRFRGAVASLGRPEMPR
jgi:hypothetical protein